MFVVFGKAVARIILKRLQVLGERIYPESQCGFRSNRSTIDMVFTLRQLKEKCREKNMSLYIAFVDLAKAFDSISRVGLYRVPRKIGCPPTAWRPMFSSMVITQNFSIRCGVKQGCVMAPCRFNIYFSSLLHHAFSNSTLGVYLHTRFDGGLFNVKRFRAKSKVSNLTVTDLLFADDAALVAHCAKDLQILLDRFAASCAAFGLTISVSKTVVMCQGAVEDQLAPIEVSVSNRKLEVVNEFWLIHLQQG